MAEHAALMHTVRGQHLATSLTLGATTYTGAILQFGNEHRNWIRTVRALELLTTGATIPGSTFACIFSSLDDLDTPNHCFQGLVCQGADNGMSNSTTLGRAPHEGLYPLQDPDTDLLHGVLSTGRIVSTREIYM